MRADGRRIALLACCLALAVATAAGPSEGTANSNPLHFKTFADLVVDDQYGHVFVSPGPGSDVIDVLDFRAQFVATIEDEPGASGMVLRDDGLYVVAADANRIDVIDRDSLQRKDSFSIPRPSTPSFLGSTGDELWFGTGRCPSDRGAVAALNPSTRVVRVSSPSTAYQCAAVITSPYEPDTIFTFEADYASPNLTRWDVRKETPRALFSEVVPYPIKDAEFTPDGGRMLVPQGPLGAYAYDTTDLKLLRGFAQGRAVAIALDPVGARVATAIRVADPDRQILLEVEKGAGFGSSEATSFQVFGRVQPGGLELSSSYHLFGVLDEGDWETLATTPIDALDSDKLVRLKLTASRVHVSPGERVTVSLDSGGRLVGAYNVELVAVSRFGSSRSLGPIPMADDGTGKLAVRIRHDVSLYAVFTGTGGFYPSTSNAVRVATGPDVGVILYGGSFEKGIVVYRSGAVPSLQGSVQPARDDKPLEFISQFKRDGRWVLEDRTTFRTDERGLVPARFAGGKAGVLYRLRVRFGRHASAWRRFRFEDGSSRRPGLPARGRGFLRGEHTGVGRCATC